MRRRDRAGQYAAMSEEENETGPERRGNTVRARVFLITMLLLIGSTVGLLIYAYLRAGPPAP